MSEWKITAVLFETNGHLQVGFTATRERDGRTETTSDFVLAANVPDAHAECRNYAAALGVSDYTFVDERSSAAA